MNFTFCRLFIASLFTFLLLNFKSQAQQFKFLHNTPDELTVVDAIEDSLGYWIFGYKGKQSVTPEYLYLSKKGVLLKDSIDTSLSGYGIIGIVETDSSYIIGYGWFLLNPNKLIIKEVAKDLKQVKKTYSYQGNLNFGAVNVKLLDDSILVLTGQLLEPDSGIRYVRDAAAYILNLNNGKDTIVNMGTSAKTLDQVNDVLYIGGKYYFVVSTDSNLTSNCISTSIAIRRFNKNLILDTMVGICNSAANSSLSHKNDLYHEASALKINEKSFMISAKSDRGNVFTNDHSDLGYVVLDTNFMELKAAVYGKRDSASLEGFKLLSRYQTDSSIYVSGTENYEVNPYGCDTMDSFYALRKTDLQAKPKWTRYYTNNSYLQLYKILATSDGGALLVGTAYDEKVADSCEKDAWILKVVSNGNYKKLTSLVEQEKIPDYEFSFFPNPFNEELNFRQLNQIRKLSLKIFDLQGRIVVERQIIQSEATINLSHLPKGIYLYRLAVEAGNTSSGKLSKQ